MCGADRPKIAPKILLPGSPPHVRGGSVVVRVTGAAVGFTPACAGRIGLAAPGWLPDRVHPRMCGADWAAAKSDTHKAGSPPHVRGGF